MEYVLGEMRARRAASEAERTLDLVCVLLTCTWCYIDRARKVIERSAAGECLSSWHAQTKRVFHCHGPCQLAVLATASDHLPCTIMMILTGALQHPWHHFFEVPTVFLTHYPLQ